LTTTHASPPPLAPSPLWSVVLLFLLPFSPFVLERPGTLRAPLLPFFTVRSLDEKPILISGSSATSVVPNHPSTLKIFGEFLSDRPMQAATSPQSPSLSLRNLRPPHWASQEGECRVSAHFTQLFLVVPPVRRPRRNLPFSRAPTGKPHRLPFLTTTYFLLDRADEFLVNCHLPLDFPWNLQIPSGQQGGVVSLFSII